MLFKHLIALFLKFIQFYISFSSENKNINRIRLIRKYRYET